ncbi:MAG TPA: cytosine permease [Candidatus Methylomirabilis sp.]|nr:cytosine permease [Candidatus Methylomirabilis sp.]
MATEATAELRADVHRIEPIPQADKDSTGIQQMWIWAGANIAPINWALGALGIVLKLGLWETIAVIVLGNIVGCGIFAAFYFLFHSSFAKAFDNWMISLLLWMSPWTGVVLADFFILRRERTDVDELYKDPARSAYGDNQLGSDRCLPGGSHRRLVRRGRSRARAAGADRHQAARRCGPELAGWHRGGRRALSGPGAPDRACGRSWSGPSGS